MNCETCTDRATPVFAGQPVFKGDFETRRCDECGTTINW